MNISNQKVFYAGNDLHDAVEATAMVADQSQAFNVDYITFISNDGTDDVYLNFDNATGVKGQITLKPNDQITDFPRQCKVLHFSAKSDNQPFRVWGVKNSNKPS